MTEYTINGIKITSSKNQMIEDLLNDKYGYNHTCECGQEQTGSSLYNILKFHHEINGRYKCKICNMSYVVTVRGIKYRSVGDATEATWNETDCRCKRCNALISKGAWYQRIQKGSQLDLCHSCSMSDLRTELNKIYHDDLSEQIRQRNYKNWQNPEYYKKMRLQFLNTIERLRNSTEKCYGPNGDMTFSEYRSWYMSLDGPGNIFNSEFMYNLWNNKDYYDKMIKERNTNEYRSWSVTAFNKDVLKCKEIYKLLIDDLLSDYDRMYGEVNLYSISGNYIDLQSKFNSIGLKCDRYIDFCIKNEIKISPYGNHHAYPLAIFGYDYEDYRMKVDIKTHSLLHYLLVLDNFEVFCYCDAIDHLMLKLIGGVMARYMLGYRKYVNNGTLNEYNNQLTPYLLDVIETLFIY